MLITKLECTHRVLSQVMESGDGVFACAGKVICAPLGWLTYNDKLKAKQAGGIYLAYWTECLVCNGDVIGGKHELWTNIPHGLARWALVHGNCRCAQAQDQAHVHDGNTC